MAQHSISENADINTTEILNLIDAAVYSVQTRENNDKMEVSGLASHRQKQWIYTQS